jgi:hypothetical protein
MMTHTEALDRAKRIWPGTHHAIEDDDNPKAPFGVIVDDIWHALDGQGHVTCHSKCEDLEAKADGRRETERTDQLEQLVREAVAALDPEDANHESIDIRAWLHTARATLNA